MPKTSEGSRALQTACFEVPWVSRKCEICNGRCSWLEILESLNHWQIGFQVKESKPITKRASLDRSKSPTTRSWYFPDGGHVLVVFARWMIYQIAWQLLSGLFKEGEDSSLISWRARSVKLTLFVGLHSHQKLQANQNQAKGKGKKTTATRRGMPSFKDTWAHLQPCQYRVMSHMRCQDWSWKTGPIWKLLRQTSTGEEWSVQTRPEWTLMREIMLTSLVPWQHGTLL